MNTVATNEISGASLSANEFTLPTGTYFIECFVPIYESGRTKLRLKNITDTTFVLEGTGNSLGVDTQSLFNLHGRFTIASQKTFALQIYAANGGTSNYAATQGTEVYADVLIWKVA